MMAQIDEKINKQKLKKMNGCDSETDMDDSYLIMDENELVAEIKIEVEADVQAPIDTKLEVNVVKIQVQDE